mmetsp:Transcript_42734/g.64280  ORF Transcript_42734/g.64280 Transcript_42734/m.64280 type:complete len:102 (-) Transcript_42734:1085-1390(-)
MVILSTSKKRLFTYFHAPPSKEPNISFEKIQNHDFLDDDDFFDDDDFLDDAFDESLVSRDEIMASLNSLGSFICSTTNLLTLRKLGCSAPFEKRGRESESG